MKSYARFEELSRDTDRALEVLRKIGRPQRTTAPGVGYLFSLNVSACIHHQEIDGAANYHNNIDIDNALSEAAKEMWPQLRERAEAIMEARRQEALVQCRAELEAALSNINKLSA